MIVQGLPVADWVLGKPAHDQMTGLGCLRDDKLIAGFAFEGYGGKNVWAHQRQEGLSRELWKAAADYVFNVMGCERVTGPVPASNVKAIKLNKHIGYELEATLKAAAPDGSDLLLMVLWRDKCRILGWDK